MQELYQQTVLYHENFNLHDIVTPVDYQILEDLLNEFHYDESKTRFLVEGFRSGFSIQYEGPKQVRRFAPNLKFRIGNETIL